LLPAAVASQVRRGWRRKVALVGVAQSGIAILAMGVGSVALGWAYVAALALVRSALLQSQGREPLAWIALCLLPLYMLALLAGPTLAGAPWAAPLLALGVLLVACALLGGRTAGGTIDWRTILPIRLQLALA